MKKNVRIAMMIGIVALMGSLMAGCGQKADETANADASAQITDQSETETEATEADNTASEDEAADTKEEDSAADEGSEVGMANPWRECTEDEAKAACPRLFKAPDDAVVNGWTIMDSTTDEAGALVQLDFSADGNEFTARAQYGAAEDADIAGMYYDWTATEDVALSSWGYGNMQGVTKRYIGDGEMVDLCTWYDQEIGIAYSLSVAAEDLEGFDITAVANQMYDAANEPETDDSETVGTEDDGQNPVMNIVGDYNTEKFLMEIYPEGKNVACINVYAGYEDGSRVLFEMSGVYDDQTNTITYDNCTKVMFVSEEESYIEYSDGTGSIKVNDDYTLVWTDDQENFADGIVIK